MCGRRGPAAAADHVDQAGLGEVAEQAGGLVRLLVVAAERIRQAGVRVTADVRVGQQGEFLDMRAHLGSAERAVHPHDERLGVLDRGPERLDRLPRQRPAGQVDDGDGDPQRQVRHHVPGRRDSRLGVQGVEDRLDEQQVHAALSQRRHLLGIRGVDVVEGNGPERRVVDPRRQGQGDVQRPDRARHQPAGRLAADLVDGLAGEPRASEVHVPDRSLQAVVCLADARRRECVGGGDIGAGGEVLPVDIQDDVGPGEVQNVRIAGHVVRVLAEDLAAIVPGCQPSALQHRAPRAIEDQDPLVKQAPDGFGVGHHCRPSRTGPEETPPGRDSLGVFDLVAKLSSNLSRSHQSTSFARWRLG